MGKTFSYQNAKSKDKTTFRVVKGEHKALLRTVCSNTVSGYVIDEGSYIIVARHAAHDIAAHCVRHGWSLGV